MDQTAIVLTILVVIFALIDGTTNVQLRSLLTLSTNDDDIIVKLVSRDNQVLNVSKQLIQSHSTLIGDILKGMDSEDNSNDKYNDSIEIPISNIDSAALSTILTYLNVAKYHTKITRKRNGCDVKFTFIFTCLHCI